MYTKNHNHMMYGFWDTEWDRQMFLSFLAIFGYLALSAPWQPRKWQFWRLVRNTWRYYHFTHAHPKRQSYDVWFLRYGVRQTEFFVILDQFLSFYPLWAQKIKILKKTGLRYYHFTQVYYKWQLYVCFLRYGMQNTEFWTNFCLFTSPPMDPENQNFENMKTMLGNIIILLMCTINDNHMMYGSWDMKCDGY